MATGQCHLKKNLFAGPFESVQLTMVRKEIG